MADMVAAALRGDRAAATQVDQRLVALHRNLFVESNPIPVKWALARMGLMEGALRLPLTLICARAGVSVRTLERAFRRDIGTDFESWRRQLRLMKAVEMLTSGRTVKEAALSVGYQQPGAFVALFRGTFGTTPKAWVSALQRLDQPSHR